ncbi:hypothetical protein CEXT_155451, partial [Caerostris extrusa]
EFRKTNSFSLLELTFPNQITNPINHETHVMRKRTTEVALLLPKTLSNLVRWQREFTRGIGATVNSRLLHSDLQK